MEQQALSRCEFLQISALTAAAATTGCATNPVTGKTELMLVSESDEIQMDKEASPHQFSADYGPVQDARLNAYLTQVGQSLTGVCHRPGMPYSFRCLNASYINAYTFPAGSMATTRGILQQLNTEAELAALLGHEIAHVTSRHTARAMSKSLLITGALVTASVLLEQSKRGEDYVPWVEGLGGIGAGLLLAKYSRHDEDRADKIGMEYEVKAGYTPQGMVGLLDMLRKLNREKPNVVERLFSSHPWAEDRYTLAAQRAATDFAASASLPDHRQRFMDMTASLRKQKGLSEAIQKGDEEMEAERAAAAEAHYALALKQGPADYEALMKMANCKLVQERGRDALGLVRQAKAVSPGEPQAFHLAGMIQLAQKEYEKALGEFDQYGKTLPGNAYTDFYRGRCQEGLGRRSDAADLFMSFVEEVDEGKEFDYARSRLIEWGYIKPEPAQNEKSEGANKGR